MENLSVSFAPRRNPATEEGVQTNSGQTAAEFVKGRANVVFRGVSSDCQSVLSAGEQKEGTIKSFLLKTVWDYNVIPAQKTNEQKLNAMVIVDGSIFTVSLMAHQTHLRVGQVVTVRASNEYFSTGNRQMLSAEILD